MADDVDLPNKEEELTEPSTPSHMLDKVLDFGELKPDELFVDAGCGEGIVIEKAVTKYKVRAIGIEIHENLANKAKERTRVFETENRVLIINGNFYNFNFKDIDILYLYLPTVDPMFGKKLKNELKTGARILSLDCYVPGWKPERIKRIPISINSTNCTYIGLYRQSCLQHLYSRLLDKIR